MKTSQAGKLLIAIPELPDSNFYRTVVFVIEHSDEGAMGVILNRPTNVKLSELWRKLDLEGEVAVDEAVHLGGPVKGPVLALHDQFRISDIAVSEQVYMTMSSDRLNELVTEQTIRLKVFSGYSGWGPGQLDMEIESGGWLLVDAQPDDIFDSSESMWKRVCEQFGQQIMFTNGIRLDQKIDPNLN